MEKFTFFLLRISMQVIDEEVFGNVRKVKNNNSPAEIGFTNELLNLGDNLLI